MTDRIRKRRQPCELKQPKKHTSLQPGWVSSNWSGYAKLGSPRSYQRISAEWTVPYVLPSRMNAYSSAWIGIDGYNNADLIQTGTSHDWINGKPVYYAWWEILPSAETMIPFPVSPGDKMQASITKITRKTWCITLRNGSKGWTFRTVQRYSGPQSSAEWIVEAPTVAGVTSALSKFTPIQFRHCRLNGRSPQLRSNLKGIMIQSKQVLAVPGPPNRCKDGFVVRRVSGNG